MCCPRSTIHVCVGACGHTNFEVLWVHFWKEHSVWYCIRVFIRTHTSISPKVWQLSVEGLLPGDYRSTPQCSCDKPPSAPGTFSCTFPCLRHPMRSISPPVSELFVKTSKSGTSVVAYPVLPYRTAHMR